MIDNLVYVRHMIIYWRPNEVVIITGSRCPNKNANIQLKDQSGFLKNLCTLDYYNPGIKFKVFTVNTQ
jgi:hypothetical protein